MPHTIRLYSTGRLNVCVGGSPMSLMNEAWKTVVHKLRTEFRGEF